MFSLQLNHENTKSEKQKNSKKNIIKIVSKQNGLSCVINLSKDKKKASYKSLHFSFTQKLGNETTDKTSKNMKSENKKLMNKRIGIKKTTLCRKT